MFINSKLSNKILPSLFKVLFVFVFLAVPFYSEAAFSLQEEYQPKSPQIWVDVAVSGNGKVFVAITSNTVFLSSDKGKTWNNVVSDIFFFDGILTGIAISDSGKKIVVSNYDGHLYLSNDFGVSWSKLVDAPENYWQDVDMSGDGKYIVAVSGTKFNNDIRPGKIYLSKDFGDSFTELTSSPERFWSSVSISNNGSKIIATSGSDDFVYISNDGGLNWVSKISLGKKRWTSPFVSSDGNLMMVVSRVVYDHIVNTIGSIVDLVFFRQGDAGYINLSRDGGSSWVELTNAGINNWNALSASDDGQFIIGSFSVLDKDDVVRYYLSISRDYGNSWSVIDNGSEFISSISVSLLGGSVTTSSIYSGGLFTSTDGAHSFKEEILTGGSGSWVGSDISIDGKHIWFAQGGGYLVYSGNGGIDWITILGTGKRTWNNVSVSDSGQYVAASFIDDDGKGGGVLLSSDYGFSWESIDDLEGKVIPFVDISADGSKMTASVGSEFEFVDYIYTSIDFGNTWNAKKSLGKRNWQSAKIVGDNTIIAIDNNFSLDIYKHKVRDRKKVFISNDFGDNWKEQDFIGEGYWGEPIVSFDKKSVFVMDLGHDGDNLNSVYSSNDGGLNWNKLHGAFSGAAATNLDGSKVLVDRGPYVYTFSLSNDKKVLTEKKLDDFPAKYSIASMELSSDGKTLAISKGFGGIEVYKEVGAPDFSKEKSFLNYNIALADNLIMSKVVEDELEDLPITPPVQSTPVTLTQVNQIIDINPNNSIIKPVTQNTAKPIYGPIQNIVNNNSIPTITPTSVVPTTPITPTAPIIPTTPITPVAPITPTAPITPAAPITPEIIVLSPVAKTKIPVDTELRVDFKTNVTGDYKIQAIHVATGQVNNLSVMTVTDTTKVHTFTKILTLNDFGFGGYKIRVGCSSCASKPYGVSSNFIFHGVGDTGYSILSDLQFSLIDSGISIVEEGGDKIIKSNFKIKAKAIGETLEIPTLKGDFYSFNLYVDGNRTSPLQGNPVWASLAKSSNVEVSFEHGEFLSKASDGRYKLNASEEEIINVNYEINMGDLLPSGKDVKVVLSTIRNNNKHFPVDFKTQTSLSIIERIKNTAGAIFSLIFSR